jgi:predicted MFS family arabinose efflux permease
MIVIYGLAYFQRTGIPGTIFDELQHDFRLSASAVTALGSVFVYVYASLQLLAGMAADRYGGRKTLLFGSLVMCVGAALFPVAHSASLLFIARILIGFGSSFVYLSIVKEVDTLFSARHFASLLGLSMLASYAGNIAATLPFERAVHAFGWRMSLGVVAGLTTLAVAVAWFVLRRLPPSHTKQTRWSLRPVWDVLRNRRSRPILICGLINFPILFVIQGVLGKKFLQDVAGMSSAGAAFFVLVMGCVCGLAAVCGGPVLRWTHQRRKPVVLIATVAILAATGLMLSAVILRAPGWVYLVGYALLACSILGLPANSAIMKEVNRPDAVAATISVLNTVVYVGVGVLGNLTGFILDRFAAQSQTVGARVVYPPAAYATLFAFLTILALVSTLITVLQIPETHGRAVTLQDIERDWN